MITNQKKTKIVATLGPASEDYDTMMELVKAGVNVFRINMSHAEPELAMERAEKVRKLNKELGTNISILVDLQGPKLRVGEIAPGTVLKQGDVLTFTNTPAVGGAGRAYMTYQGFAKDVKSGERILLDDGKLVLETLSTNGRDEVKAVVIQGGDFKSKKGVNLPNTKISLPALTEKDKQDVRTGVGIGADWFALSFVRNAADIKLLRDEIAKYTERQIPIISKIEKPEALDNIDEILGETNAIMVARGDLGIEIPAEKVPLVQKELVRKARMNARPVIIATQMMESMINSMTPSRSDVNDVANSVIDGADAVMLSGETSVGRYPVEVIHQMTKIIRAVEPSLRNSLPMHLPSDESRSRYLSDFVCYHASQIAVELDAKAICTITNTGYTAYRISSQRPMSSILAFTFKKEIATQLNLLWGVRAFYYGHSSDSDNAVEDVNKIALREKYIVKGDKVVNLITLPFNSRGHVNTLRISTAE